MTLYSFNPIIGSKSMQFIKHSEHGSELVFEFDKKYEAKIQALVLDLNSRPKPKTVVKTMFKKATKLRSTREYDKLKRFANSVRRSVKSLDWKMVK